MQINMMTLWISSRTGLSQLKALFRIDAEPHYKQELTYPNLTP